MWLVDAVAGSRRITLPDALGGFSGQWVKELSRAAREISSSNANVAGVTFAQYLTFSMNLYIINLTSPVGFSLMAFEALSATEGVYEVLEATPSEDGLYRDLWLRVSEDFNEIAAELARHGVQKKSAESAMCPMSEVRGSIASMPAPPGLIAKLRASIIRVDEALPSSSACAGEHRR